MLDSKSPRLRHLRQMPLHHQGLRNIHHVHQLRKMNLFALVSIWDNNNNLCSRSSQEKTSIDSVGNTKPKWNFHVTFNIDITRAQENHLALVVKFKSRWIIGDRDIGEVCVPITELLEGFGNANAVAHEKHMSKSVLNPNGTSQGTLSFYYKFGNTIQQQHPPASMVNIRPVTVSGFFSRRVSSGGARNLSWKRLKNKIIIIIIVYITSILYTII